MSRRTRTRAFTLIEAVLVVLVLALTIPSGMRMVSAAERAQRMTDPDTRVFKMGETVAMDQTPVKDAKGKKKAAPAKKKKPAKLPAKRDNSKDSQEAAAQRLRGLFNRG